MVPPIPVRNYLYSSFSIISILGLNWIPAYPGSKKYVEIFKDEKLRSESLCSLEEERSKIYLKGQTLTHTTTIQMGARSALLVKKLKEHRSSLLFPSTPENTGQLRASKGRCQTRIKEK